MYSETIDYLLITNIVTQIRTLCNPPGAQNFSQKNKSKIIVPDPVSPLVFYLKSIIIGFMKIAEE